MDRERRKDDGGERGRVRGQVSGDRKGVKQEGGKEGRRNSEDIAVEIGEDIRAVAEVVSRLDKGVGEAERARAMDVLVGVMGAVNELVARQVKMERRAMEAEMESMREEMRRRELEREREAEREEWRRKLEEESRKVRELESELEEYERGGRSSSREEKDGGESEKEGESMTDVVVEEREKEEEDRAEKKKQAWGVVKKEGEGKERGGERKGGSSVGSVEDEGASGGPRRSGSDRGVSTGTGEYRGKECEWPKVGEGEWSVQGRGKRAEGRMSENVEREEGMEGKIIGGETGGKIIPGRSGFGEEGIVVRSKEGKGAREVMRELVERISAREIGGAPQAVKAVGLGEVLIVPKDREQWIRIRERVSKMGGMEVRDSKRSGGFVMISGVDAGMVDGEIKEWLARNLEGRMREGKEEMMVMRRMRCRNVWRENVIVRMGANDWREAVRMGEVEMGESACNVEEYVDVLLCFRCCEYGHVSRVCKGRVKCYVCSGEHDGRECKRERLRCVNCARTMRVEGEHEARDVECPVWKEMVRRAKGKGGV